MRKLGEEIKMGVRGGEIRGVGKDERSVEVGMGKDER